MKKPPAIGLMALLLALGLGGQPAWADEGHGYGKGDGHETHRLMGHHGGAGHYLRHLLRHQKEIGLTDEQVAKLQALRLDLDRTRIRAEAEIQVAERELASLVKDEKTELATIEAKLKQREELAVGLRMAAIKARRDAAALLTPEQREKEKAEHEKMLRHHRES
ncbi:MAG: Spy/CpxP family protein refolding chaperone [Nitrospirota bacterium]